jgi:hypothetical protein
MKSMFDNVYKGLYLVKAKDFIILTTVSDICTWRYHPINLRTLIDKETNNFGICFILSLMFL